MEAAGESGRAAARAGDGQRGARWALAVLEHACDIVLLLDGAGRVAYVNAAVERLLGIPPPALLGRSALDRVHPEDAENVRGRIAAHLAGAETAEPMIYRLRHADGSWRWVESITASRLDDPAVRGVVVSTRDATERVRTEAALRDSERRAREHLAAADRAARELALLDRVRAALARQLDLPTLFGSVVEAVAETFGYSQVSLYLREGDVSVLQHQVGYDRVLARIPVTVGVSGRVIRTGRPVLLEDVAADPAFLGAIEDIHSEVCVPLRDGDRVVGFLNLESTGGGRLGPGDLRLMEALAEHVGIAIGRTRAYQQARLSEERFRTAFASSAMGTALVGLDGRWLTVNRALCEIVGYTEEELQRRTFQEITHPDDLAEDARLIGLLLAGEIPAIRFEKRYIHQRGYPVWVFVTGSLVRDDDGAPLSFLAQVQDITERRRAAAELAAERDLLDRLLEHLPEAVYVKDAASRFLRLNPTAARLLGANDPAEVLGKTDFDFFSEPMARAYFEAEQQVVATGEPRFNQLETHGEDGPAPAWWLNSTVPLRDAGGAIVGLVGSSREVTERLRAEAELRASEERLRLALEAASMASWDWDAATGAAVRSAAMPALFGLPAEAANAPRQRYRDLVHPDDRPKLRAADRRLTTDHGTYEVEYRVVRPDGQVRWLRDRGVAFLGADGALARVLGITQDVTERKRGEEELVAAKEAAEEANRLKGA